MYYNFDTSVWPIALGTCDFIQKLPRPKVSERYELKLVNGEETATSLSGRLEVFFSGVWGPVCGDGVNEVTAASVCRFLGYRYGRTTTYPVKFGF